MNEPITQTLTRLRDGLTTENLNQLFRNLHFGRSEEEAAKYASVPSPDDAFTAFEEHNYYEMTIQLDKHTLVQVGPHVYDLQPGQFCVIPPGMQHRIKWGSKNDPTADMMWINITGEIVRTSCTAYAGETRSKVWGSDLTIPGSFMIGEVFAEKEKNRPGSAQAIVSYLRAFFSLLLQNVDFQSESAGVRWTGEMVAQVQRYIRDHLGEPLSLTDLSANVSLSPNYLCKIFKDVTGETITHYTQNLKVERSIELMKEGLSLGAIADQLGFCDQFYFSKVFKSFMCISPMQFRKSIRQQGKTA
ncbi:MAG: AraC family transcriptional regulator [Lachnospiraceae bacterium]|nr:AraC family transcriptional regulator [Lachnospiraceae bacterium]